MVNEEFKGAIALTGSISTGKSSVSKILQDLGFPIIDADKVAHSMLELHSHELSSMFGNSILQNGIVNRKKLGEIVFNDESKRKELEEFIHPIIYKTILAKASEYEAHSKVYFIDIPLFFENKSYDIKKSIVVYTPKDLQLQRLIQRDSISLEMAKSRIDMQICIEEKAKLGTHVIDNSGTKEELRMECKRVLKELNNDSN